MAQIFAESRVMFHIRYHMDTIIQKIKCFFNAHSYESSYINILNEEEQVTEFQCTYCDYVKIEWKSTAGIKRVYNEEDSI